MTSRSAAGRAAALTAAIAAALAVSGCGQAQPTAPDDPAVPASSGVDSPPRTTEQQLQAFAAEAGLEDPPEVTVVRTVHPDESAEVTQQCLTDAGWTVQEGPDGQPFFEYPNEQTEAFNLAWYTCKAQYPVEERYLQPLPEDKLELLYVYHRDTYIPCLRQQGFNPAEQPTLETFVASEGQWSPLPFDEVADAIAAGDLTSFEELEETCPSSPGWDVLYGG